MLETIAPLIQSAFAAGLVYGWLTMIRYWDATVPAGAESDSEFTRHGALRARA